MAGSARDERLGIDERVMRAKQVVLRAYVGLHRAAEPDDRLLADVRCGHLLDLPRVQDRSHDVELRDEAFVGFRLSMADLAFEPRHISGNGCGRQVDILCGLGHIVHLQSPRRAALVAAGPSFDRSGRLADHLRDALGRRENEDQAGDDREQNDRDRRTAGERGIFAVEHPGDDPRLITFCPRRVDSECDGVLESEVCRVAVPIPSIIDRTRFGEVNYLLGSFYTFRGGMRAREIAGPLAISACELRARDAPEARA